MNRRSFISLLAALPAALSWRRLWPAAPVAAALEVATPIFPALTIALPAAETIPMVLTTGTGVMTAAETVPVFWNHYAEN